MYQFPKILLNSFATDLLKSADAAAARDLLKAARTDGANTFLGSQTVISPQTGFPTVLDLRSSGFVTNLRIGITGVEDRGLMVTGGSAIFSSGISSIGNQTLDLAGASVRFIHSLSSSVLALFSDTENAFRSAGATYRPLVVDLASGQTAPALSVLDSLGTTKFKVNASGSLSLGTAASSPTLEVSGDDVYLRLGNGNTNGVFYFQRGDGLHTNFYTQYNAAFCAQFIGTGNTKFSLSVAGNLSFSNDMSILWSANDAYYQTKDIGLLRGSAGIVKFSDGGSGYGGINLGAATTTTVPITVNLASGQTASAIEIRDSLNAVAFGIKYTSGTIQFISPYETTYDFTGGGGNSYILMRQLTILTPLQLGGYETQVGSVYGGAVTLVNYSTGSSGGGTLTSIPQTVTQFTADQDDLALIRGCRFYRVSSDATRTITGLAISRTDGLEFEFWNVGSFNIVLAHESTSSTAANRFACESGTDVTLLPGGIAFVRYDDTTDRFRVKG